MIEIRKAEDKDFYEIAKFEVQIAIISFGTEAITEDSFHYKRLKNCANRDGMLVALEEGKIIAWLWAESKTNSLTGDCYLNFRSFYVAEEYRNTQISNKMMDRMLVFAKSRKAKKIVGRVHVSNLPMRVVYKNNGFAPTHMTMEYNLEEGDSNG